MGTDVPSKGNIRDYSLSKILYTLNSRKTTGVLTLRMDNVEKRIYLNGGNIIFASSSDTKDRLGDMLLRKGMITAEQHERSTRLFEQTRKRKGLIFLELGYLNHRDLFLALKDQIREIVLSLFEWEDGTFEFKEGVPSSEIALKVPIPQTRGLSMNLIG